MTERCSACGTDGVTNSMGRFVSRDWLRANELSAERDSLRDEVDRLQAVVGKATHWAEHAMLMRSSQNKELLGILQGVVPRSVCIDDGRTGEGGCTADAER